MPREKETLYAEVDNFVSAQWNSKRCEVKGWSVKEPDRSIRIVVRDPRTARQLAAALTDYADQIDSLELKGECHEAK